MLLSSIVFRLSSVALLLRPERALDHLGAERAGNLALGCELVNRRAVDAGQRRADYAQCQRCQYHQQHNDAQQHKRLADCRQDDQRYADQEDTEYHQAEHRAGTGVADVTRHP
jgi:hypothetical protein